MKSPKASKQLLDLLNQAVARELQVSVQYMWQHVQCTGVKGFAVRDELKMIGIAEMIDEQSVLDRLDAVDNGTVLRGHNLDRR